MLPRCKRQLAAPRRSTAHPGSGPMALRVFYAVPGTVIAEIPWETAPAWFREQTFITAD